MDIAILSTVVSVLTVAAIVAGCIRWKVLQNREMFWTIIRQAITTRRDLMAGVAALLIYLVVYLILGNHVHWFYGRLIFTLTPWAAVVAVVSALLVGLLFVLFSYNWRTLGLSKGEKGAWGVLGTLFALVISFCPWWLPIIAALVGAGGAVVLSSYWQVLTVVSIGILILSILWMVNGLNKAMTWVWPSIRS